MKQNTVGPTGNFCHAPVEYVWESQKRNFMTVWCKKTVIPKVNLVNHSTSGFQTQHHRLQTQKRVVEMFQNSTWNNHVVHPPALVRNLRKVSLGRLPKICSNTLQGQIIPRHSGFEPVKLIILRQSVVKDNEPWNIPTAEIAIDKTNPLIASMSHQHGDTDIVTRPNISRNSLKAGNSSIVLIVIETFSMYCIDSSRDKSACMVPESVWIKPTDSLIPHQRSLSTKHAPLRRGQWFNFLQTLPPTFDIKRPKREILITPNHFSK